MINQRPKIKIPMTKLDIVIEIASIAMLILNIMIVLFSWNKLPSIIPTHFDIEGQVNGYGSKTTILILIPVIFALYIGLTILRKFPNAYNYLSEITEKNAQVQYKYATRFIQILKLELILLFTYIQYSIIQSAFAGQGTIGPLFMPIVLIVVFVTLGVYISISVQNNK